MNRELTIHNCSDKKCSRFKLTNFLQLLKELNWRIGIYFDSVKVKILCFSSTTSRNDYNF